MFERSLLLFAIVTTYIGQALSLKASAVGSVDHYERNERARETLGPRISIVGRCLTNTMIEIDWTYSMFSCPACASWGSYRSTEDFWNIDMEAWVVANEQLQLLDMIWNGNLTVSLCVELRGFFLWIESLLWSYGR